MTSFNVTRPDSIEVKVMVKPVSARQVERQIGLEPRSGIKRDVTFFDTKNLDNFDNGLTLRGRVRPDKADLAVKLRPVDPSRIAPEWFQQKGFKAEPDIVGGEPVYGAQITSKRPKSLVERAARGKLNVLDAMRPEQRRFLESYLPEGARLDGIGPRGKVPTRYWKFGVEDLGLVTAERWKLPNGKAALEFSVKVAPEDQAQTEAGLADLLTALGFQLQEDQSLKTRQTMDAYRAKAAKKSAAPLR